MLESMFPAYLVGEPGSGIDELFPPRRPGRPKKRKQPDDDLEYVPLAAAKRSMRRRRTKRHNADPLVEASSGEDIKYHPIASIHLQAQDEKTGKVYVFVEWEGWPLTSSSWILLSSLAPATTNAWRLEVNCFSHFILIKISLYYPSVVTQSYS